MSGGDEMNSSMWVKAWSPQGDKAAADSLRAYRLEQAVQDTTDIICNVLHKQGLPPAKINRKMRRIEALIREVLEK